MLSPDMKSQPAKALRQGVGNVTFDRSVQD
jgi:hypothetical protein